jgi:hypothetical protein
MTLTYYYWGDLIDLEDDMELGHKLEYKTMPLILIGTEEKVKKLM